VRRPVVLLYLAILVGELSWSAVAPLLPTYQERFGLSGPETGLILSVASLAILVVSFPAGALARRFGARSLTLASAVGMTVGNLMIGFSATYPALLLGRVVFGAALGMLWVAGTSWLHDASGESPKALSMTSAIIGLGSLIGPAFAGIVGERFGIGVPFVILAVVTAATFAALLLTPSATQLSAHPDEPTFRDLLRAASGDDLVRTSVLLMLVGSLLWLCSYVLVPLRLDASGWSAADIGVAFSISSLLYAGVSWWVARRAERLATLGQAALSTAALACSLLVVVLSGSTAAAVLFLLLAGAISAVMIALTFPIGVAGPRHIPVAVVGGLLNVAWASSGLLGPPLAGASAEAMGDRLTFLILLILTAAAAGWMYRARRRARSEQMDGVATRRSGR
jgi:predicted MFS family arabinose efflux permease